MELHFTAQPLLALLLKSPGMERTSRQLMKSSVRSSLWTNNLVFIVIFNHREIFATESEALAQYKANLWGDSFIWWAGSRSGDHVSKYIGKSYDYADNH